MSERADICKLVDSNLRAAGASLDKDAIDKALNSIRAAQADGQDVFDLWATIDEQVGKAQAPELQQYLITLRTRFEEELLIAEIERLERIFKHGPEAGWKAWLITLAQAITLFRLRFANDLCEHAFPFHETRKQSVPNLRKAVRCMSQSRWPEAYEQLDFLARQEFLPAGTRAKVLVTLGEIQLFHYQK